MGFQSVKVPQPAFSRWVIRRRQELNLCPAKLKEKLGCALSERTLKYLEDGKKDSYSEYTLSILAAGLDLSFPELLQKIEQLKTLPPEKELTVEKTAAAGPAKYRAMVFATVFVSIASVSLLLSSNGLIGNLNREAATAQSRSNPGQQLREALIHKDYPQVFAAYDAKGNTLWQKNLRTTIRRVELYDLDGDGDREVIAATWKAFGDEEGERPGWIYVWNEQGELLTEFNTWKPSIYPAREPRVRVVDFRITDLENDGAAEIVVAVTGEQYYPSRVAVLQYENAALREIKSYWNPGYLVKLFVEDVNGDGFPEIICTGVNNDLKRVKEFQVDDNLFAIFLLDGREIYGQAPPYLGQEQPGSEVWYYYVTTTANFRLAEIADVTFLGEKSKEIHVKLRDTCFFYLNYQGEITDRFVGDHCTGETELHLMPKEKTWK